MFISFRRGKVTVAGKIRFGYAPDSAYRKERPEPEYRAIKKG